MNLLLKKLYLEKKEFVKADLLRRYCSALKLHYDAAIKYLISAGYVVRIFRGIFYVKALEEVKLNKSRYTAWELVAKGLELKGINNWYFGLETACKLNNLTHEYFAMEYVVSDKLFRARPMTIAGYKFKFVKVKPDLLWFGVIRKGSLRYSDHEKTMLDFIYLKKYNSVPDKKILLELGEWSKKCNLHKIRKYLHYYPKTLQAVWEQRKE